MKQGCLTKVKQQDTISYAAQMLNLKLLHRFRYFLQNLVIWHQNFGDVFCDSLARFSMKDLKNVLIKRLLNIKILN
jgi:hypothetical protein